MPKGPDIAVEEVKAEKENRTARIPQLVLWVHTKAHLHKRFLRRQVVYETGSRMRCGYVDQLTVSKRRVMKLNSSIRICT
jgi:hypothetical protein